MDEEYEYSNQPLIWEVTKHDEKHRQSMMKSVLEKITLRSDKYVWKESACVLAEL